MIINTATYCQLTYQYPYFNQLKTYYKSDNFEILAFPCNQFGLVRYSLIFFSKKINLFLFLKQEPGIGTEILNGIQFVRRMLFLFL